jgi:hypothetical protein
MRVTRTSGCRSQIFADDSFPRSAVLFDGALPDSKRDERLSRLGNNNQRVRQFRINHPASSPIPRQLGSTLYPLLTPGLREALSTSDYAPVTRVVPGEADDYCALCANEAPRSVIFSNDTDLILYEYPTDGRVIFFRDVELWPEPQFKGYSTAKIRQALQLTSLVPLAYCITQDRWKSFGDLVKDARKLDTTLTPFLEFSKRYTRTSSESQSSKDDGVTLAVQALDVRVSEFVHQALAGGPRSIVQRLWYDSASLAPTIYLPFLVEDPNSVSAWNAGDDIRLLAYSLLASDGATVHEYKRRAQTIAMQEINILSAREKCIAATTISRNTTAWTQTMEDQHVHRDLIWPLIAVNIILPTLTMPPKVTWLCRVLNGDFDNTWDFLHVTAGIHAALYSLRFLKQCAAVWTSMNREGSVQLYDSVTSVHKALQGMPTIAELFIVPGQAGRVHEDSTTLKAALREMYVSANVEVPDEQISNKKLKKQKREAERKARREQVASTQRTDNLFELLNQRQKN